LGRKQKFKIRFEQQAGSAWGDARWSLVSVVSDSRVSR
jgi:hypothetical protein